MPSGADLEYARMLARAGVPAATAQGYDAARLEQIGDENEDAPTKSLKQLSDETTTGRLSDLGIANAIPVTRYGATGDGVTDDTAAIQAALNACKHVYFPEGIYNVSAQLTMPQGTHISGAKSTSYVAPPNHGARVRAITNFAGSVFYLSADSSLSDISITGYGRSSGVVHYGIRLSGHNIVTRATISHCTTAIWFNYTGVNQVTHCQLHDNLGYAIQDPVDSQISFNYINVNDAGGIYCGTGSNDNLISFNKIEFNYSHGLNLFTTTNNKVIGNVIDRNSATGVRVTSTTNSVIIGNIFRRNGRYSSGTPDNDCHIWLQSTDDIIISGNATAIGADDDGLGYISPAYTIRGHSNNNLSISSNDLGGCVTTALSWSAGNTKAPILVGNIGIVNESIARNYIDNYFTGNVTTGNITTKTGIILGRSVGMFGVGHTFDVEIIGRNTSTGSRIVGTSKAIIYREGGSAAVLLSTPVMQHGTGIALSAGSHNISASVNTDGSILDFTIANASGATFQYAVMIK